jgi:CheY-like chemotaxis protein
MEMAQEKTAAEVHWVQRRKILLVGAEPSVQGLISTFLMTMGLTCTAVQDRKETPGALQRETFDAVVIDLGPSEADAEQTILRIKQIRPSLADRILAISRSGGDQKKMLELMERHDVTQLSQEGLLPQLWASLEELLGSPPRPRETVLHSVQAARLIFDSFRRPMPVGMRGSPPPTRHLAYQHKRAVIDLSIQLQEKSGQTSLAGQVLDGEAKGKLDGLSVLLVSGTGTLARTTTNRFGEFHIEGEFPDDVSLEIRLGERSWVAVPLGKMGSAGKRTSNWQAEP